MPAAGWAAESGNPVLFVGALGRPRGHPAGAAVAPEPAHLRAGPAERDLRRDRHAAAASTGRSSASAAETRPRTRWRSPPTAIRRARYGQPCAHVPGSFGWAMRSPGHGYVLLNATRPLDAAAAAPLSGSGDYGPAAARVRCLYPPAAGAQLLPRLRDSRLHRGGTDRRRLQPRLDDRGPRARSRSRSRPRSTACWRPSRRRQMSQAEHPERLQRRPQGDGRGRPPADGRLDAALRAAAARADPQPDPGPARRITRRAIEGEREIARLDRIAFAGEIRGHPAEPGLTPLPQPRVTTRPTPTDA